MKKIIFLIIGVLILTSAFTANAEKELQELSGILKKNIKSSIPYFLELDGDLNRFNITGEILKNFNEGDRIYVKGYIVTRLNTTDHLISLKSIDPKDFIQKPNRWDIYMIVIEAKRIDKPFDFENKE